MIGGRAGAASVNCSTSRRAADHPSNRRIEGANNLIERAKRAAFGFRRFAPDRVRALLYAGRTNWPILNGLTPR